MAVNGFEKKRDVGAAVALWLVPLLRGIGGTYALLLLVTVAAALWPDGEFTDVI